jgi:hypothetical protein
VELAQRENGRARIKYYFAVVRPEKGFAAFMQEVPFFVSDCEIRELRIKTI